jgi:hypothetical protein
VQSAASLPTNAFRICEAYGGQHGRRALLKFVIPLPAAYPFFARVSLQHLLPWFWMTPKLFPPARKVHAAAARGCPRCRPSHRACRLVGNQARGRVVGRGARHPPASSPPGRPVTIRPGCPPPSPHAVPRRKGGVRTAAALFTWAPDGDVTGRSVVVDGLSSTNPIDARPWGRGDR